MRSSFDISLLFFSKGKLFSTQSIEVPQTGTKIVSKKYIGPDPWKIQKLNTHHRSLFTHHFPLEQSDLNEILSDQNSSKNTSFTLDTNKFLKEFW